MLSACFYVSFYTLCVFFFFSLPAFGSHLIFQVASSLYKVSTPQRWNEEQQISNYIAFELQTDGMPSKWQTRTFLCCNDNGFVFFFLQKHRKLTRNEWMLKMLAYTSSPNVSECAAIQGSTETFWIVIHNQCERTLQNLISNGAYCTCLPQCSTHTHTAGGGGSFVCSDRSKCLALFGLYFASTPFASHGDVLCVFLDSSQQARLLLESVLLPVG